MLSIAILDDELTILEEYEKLIPLWMKKNGIKGKIEIATTSPKVFIEDIKEQKINVCIIDIDLNSTVNGMDIARIIRKENIKTEILFSTGRFDYMPDAFDVNAYNYIPKPINEKLEKCLVKLSKEIESREFSHKTYEFKFGSSIFFIPIDEIIHIQRVGRKTVIQTTNRRLETYDTLEEIFERLNDDRFKQCHRAIIANQNFIDYLDIKKKRLVLRDGTQLEVGPKYYLNFKVQEDWSDCYAF